jgi:hypothetical protein
MRKKTIFTLIFFLVFILQFKLVNSLNTGQCHNFDTSTGKCLDGYIFDSSKYQEAQASAEETINEVAKPPVEIPTEFFTLVFQFFGIVILFIFLVILLEEVTNMD